MIKKRFQNKVAESRLALPVTAIYALLVSLAFGLVSEQLWASLALLGVSTYLMAELNNANALIRIYSRMVSCSFLVLALLSKSVFVDVRSGVVQVCFILFFLLFFQTYQDKRAVGHIFYAFLMLGIASVAFPQIVFFVPVIWILMFTNIQSGSLRTVFASLLGLVFPYVFWAVWCLYQGDATALLSHFESITVFGKPFYLASISLADKILFCFISLLALVGIVHFHRNNYKDHIRTRVLFEVFTTFNLVTILFALLQPAHFLCLVSMLVVCTAPMIGHYISLTNTRLTNISFFLIVFASLFLTVTNLWKPF